MGRSCGAFPGPPNRFGCKGNGLQRHARSHFLPVVVAVASSLPSSFAWGTAGHERIARIADGMLKVKPRDQLRSLMHGGLIDTAGWEERMIRDYPETKALHYHRQDPEWTCAGLREASPDLQHLGDKTGHIKCDGKLAQSGSLFCAVSHFFEHFAHDALLREFPAPTKSVDTPKTLAALSLLPLGEKTKANYLRWLVGLVGDMHQPMHWLREKDHGRNVTVIYDGMELSLFDFWETKVVTALPPLKRPGRMPIFSAAGGKFGHKSPIDNFRDWAEDVASKVCNDIYRPMEENHADGTRSIPTPFKITESLKQEWINLAEMMTVDAGSRIKHVLTEILEHKKHSAKHHDGRGIHFKRSRNWRQSLATNLFIAAFVVPITIGLLRYHLSIGGMSLREMFSRKKT